MLVGEVKTYAETIDAVKDKVARSQATLFEFVHGRGKTLDDVIDARMLLSESLGLLDFLAKSVETLPGGGRRARALQLLADPEALVLPSADCGFTVRPKLVPVPTNDDEVLDPDGGFDPETADAFDASGPDDVEVIPVNRPVHGQGEWKPAVAGDADEFDRDLAGEGVTEAEIDRARADEEELLPGEMPTVASLAIDRAVAQAG
jgi:hypothetical protein